LEEPKKLIVDVIPGLEREYEELMRELEKEQAEVAEIEAGDQDYLNELKATIAEQKWVLSKLDLYSLLTSCIALRSRP
jgi:kinetochore protein Spc7/SPC105